MKVIFLLPPSEGKNSENKYVKEEVSFNFEKPINIVNNVSEKDLKCSWKRFEEWLLLNKNIEYSETIEAIKRYSGVMFSAIDYENMNNNGKYFFQENFIIFSWMYGIVKPLDKIGNYKLPIESTWLLDFLGDKVIYKLNALKPDFVVNLLPISYWKLIFWKNKKQEEVFNKLRKFKIININFLKLDWKKIAHWVKKIKGEWIKNISEQNTINYKNFGWKIIEKKNNIIDINIIMFN
jgi:cytoplasmic iron level regulating protein YaaA (DUF328/UPF0246 family)